MIAQERITQLNSEIADIEDFLAYWRNDPEFDQVEEAPARIAVLETDLENLRTELKALMECNTTYFGFYFDVFELDFALHMERMVIQAQDDPKTAQLRAAGFIGEDYNGTGPKPNTLHNFVESRADFERLFAILEPELAASF